jgi:GNAT superfamily N-acetyltransferase
MIEHIPERIIARPFQSDDDFWQLRNLLIETYPITPTGLNWDIRHWDGWHFHGESGAWNPIWEKQVHLWEAEGVAADETGHRRVVGFVHPEYTGDAFFELHPDYRNLEAEMLSWAEQNLTTLTSDKMQHQLQIFAFEYDAPRRQLLEQRGYEKMPWSGVRWRLRFGSRPTPESALAAGYRLCTTLTGDDGDYQRAADILNAGFNRTIHTAQEYRTFTSMSPSYRRELDLVAVTPDGTYAALVGMAYDEINHFGIFEPVCTHPDHRQKGLARSLMFEGMRRLRSLGATDIYVDTGDAVPANRLYAAVGFTEAYMGYIWRKDFLKEIWQQSGGKSRSTREDKIRNGSYVEHSKTKTNCR